eukprot:TRINITY_DN6612_c0_g1_i1.p2 TRINITY_DN6612_c0_g1~~TRINITY_DN6612_c0_g1_i1.p2  ORF type:complete len:254 (+),score=58.99 TRINITY_DN6612_c0_g1_i1:205-966(+)
MRPLWRDAALVEAPGLEGAPDKVSREAVVAKAAAASMLARTSRRVQAEADDVATGVATSPPAFVPFLTRGARTLEQDVAFAKDSSIENSVTSWSIDKVLGGGVAGTLEAGCWLSKKVLGGGGAGARVVAKAGVPGLKCTGVFGWAVPGRGVAGARVVAKAGVPGLKCTGVFGWAVPGRGVAGARVVAKAGVPGLKFIGVFGWAVPGRGVAGAPVVAKAGVPGLKFTEVFGGARNLLRALAFPVDVVPIMSHVD